MNVHSWHAFYQSDFQSVYALLVVPTAFLAYRLLAKPDSSRAIVPAASRFVAGLTILFTIETLIDPLATGPLLKQTRLGDTTAALLIPFLFVYLGDLRVLWLAKGVAGPDSGLGKNLAWASGMALIVPIWAGLGFGLARSISADLHGQWLWILYESGFLALCVGLIRFWVPRHFANEPATATYLRTVFGYSAAYYGLWLTADILIVGGGLDLGWAIRVIPNQLYYSLWAPFVFWRFFSGAEPGADAKAER